MSGGDAVVIIDDGGRKKTVLIMAGVVAVAVLLTLALVLVLYHPPSKPRPTNATSPVNTTSPVSTTPPVNVTPPVNITLTQALYLVIYNPSDQPTANPHDQPITMTCSLLQKLWQWEFGYSPSCQSIAYNVTFIENNQVLPAYPIINGNLITWWVRMPGIPAKSSVDVSVILGNSSSITNPANVFLIYGDISSFQPGYVYILNTTGGGITIISKQPNQSGIFQFMPIYNQSGVYPFIYVANGTAWLFTPTSNGLIANPIGSGYLGIAVTPSGQYLVSAQPSLGNPLQGTYQPTPLVGSYGITHIPQSVLDELAGLGAVYITPLVNPPPYNGSLALVSLNPFYIQLPQCNITSNPYGGATGMYGLPNCLAIEDGGVWAVIRFYYQPGDEGAILGFSAGPYPNNPPGNYVPQLYISNDLYFGDWTFFSPTQVSFLLSPGWHTLIVGEYYSGGNYYVVAYLDSAGNSASNSGTYSSQLFGSGGPYPYYYVGTGFTTNWPNAPGGWFFYNGIIAYVAFYGGGASVGASLANNVFSIASQQESYVPGYAIDYPPGGVEPVVIIVYLKTPSGLSTLLPSQLGIINYAMHIVGS